MVSRDARGEVIGHVALEREPGAAIAERGEAVVLPSYRGRHLLERMTERLTDEALRLGLVGIYAEPVTTHTFSQRNDERAGMPTCAILLGAAPETLHSKDLPVPTAGQRQSFLLTFRYLQPSRVCEIVAPREYLDVISATYDCLGVGVSRRDSKTPAETRSMTSLTVNTGGYGRILLRDDWIERRHRTRPSEQRCRQPGRSRRAAFRAYRRSRPAASGNPRALWDFSFAVWPRPSLKAATCC